MSKKAKLIISCIIACITGCLIMMTVGFYFIYQIGMKNGYLEESSEKKQDNLSESSVEDQERNLEDEKMNLEYQYVNHEITYEEYKKKKEELQMRERQLSQGSNRKEVEADD